MNTNQSPLQPYYWILLSGFTFSWMATFAQLAGHVCTWPVLAMVRCGIPLVLVLIWCKCSGVKLILWGSPTLWVRSLAGSCSLIGTFYAFGIHMPNTDIYTICNIFPIWVALLSWPMLGRFPSPAVWISIVCSIAGVAVIQGAELKSGQYGALVIVAVSMLSAVAMMGLNRLKHLDPRAIVVHFSATAMTFSVISFFVFTPDQPTVPFETHHLFQLLGVGGTAAFGQYFLTRAFTSGDPAKVSVASLSQFVFILLLDIFVIGRTIDPSKLWGIPLILGPTLWLMLQRTRPVPSVEPIAPALANEPTIPAQAVAALACEPNITVSAEMVFERKAT